MENIKVYNFLIIGTISSLMVVKVETQAPNITLLTKGNFTEEPFWDHINQVLLFVDIGKKSVHRLNTETMEEQVLNSTDETISFILPLRDREKYQFISAVERDLILLTWDLNDNSYTSCLITSVDVYSEGNRWNDAKADTLGRIWGGTLGPKGTIGLAVPCQAAFYRVDTLKKGNVFADVEIKPVSISNGLVWSSDNEKLFYIDSLTRRVDSFAFDLIEGTISNRTPVFYFDDYGIVGVPDGMTIDSDGNLWVAAYGAGLILNVDPITGELIRTVEMPVLGVTSMVFGGPRLDVLYVTSWTVSESIPEPLAGSVFKVTGLGVTGTLSNYPVLNSDCSPVY